LKSRVLLLFACLMGLWSLLVGRALFLQIFPNQKLTQLEKQKFQTAIHLQSRRGAIVDIKGKELAMSSKVYSLFADPSLLERKKKLAQKLANVLGGSWQEILNKIDDKNKKFVWIERKLSKEKYDVISSWKIHGLSFIEEYKRVYPSDQLASQILGFIGTDGHGLEGVERHYDEALHGNAKKVTVRRDARGRPLLADGLIFTEAPDGAEIKLTLDSELQYVLESELMSTVSEFQADQAYGVILDAKTSAIRALATMPSYNSNAPLSASADLRRNKSVTDAFEPGSTMKTLVIAAALQEKKIQPDSRFFCENGKMQIGKHFIHEAEAKHSFGWLTVSDILAFSSNIGTTKIAFDLGDKKLNEGLKSFGLGSKMEVDLPGEAKGSIQELPWQPHLLSNISFGHGIAATPLQMANAYAAIANGGTLNKPWIVESIRDGDTGELKTFQAKKIRQVISAEVAEKMRKMLMGVTAPGGTGENAKVPGFLVAGKTGTAQKVNPLGRGYIKGGYISSFAGFIPANDPQFVIYVAVDHPKKNSYYGAQVAAPLFSRIAGYAVRQYGLVPSQMTAEVKSPSKIKKSENLNLVKKDSKVEQEIMKDGIVPDLKNLSLRQALRKIQGLDLKVQVQGQGRVKLTEPSAGSTLNDKKELKIQLE
jgi:cell division protein FtsI (penicillin-binding protein 3)